jgi:hypothetical protein
MLYQSFVEVAKEVQTRTQFLQTLVDNYSSELCFVKKAMKRQISLNKKKICLDLFFFYQQS